MKGRAAGLELARCAGLDARPQLTRQVRAYPFG